MEIRGPTNNKTCQTSRNIIVSSYAVLGTRWLSAETIFGTMEGEILSTDKLARRQKLKAVDIPWSTYTQLGQNFAQRMTPSKAGPFHASVADEEDEDVEEGDGEVNEEPGDEDPRGEDLGDEDDGFDEEGMLLLGPGQFDGADEPSSTLNTPQRKKWTVHTALAHICKKLSKQFGKARTAIANHNYSDDKRKCRFEIQKNQRMLLSFFRYHGITQGWEMIRFLEERPQEMPSYCLVEWKLSGGFFNVEAAKKGRNLSFGVIVHDEAQNVRNMQSRHNILAELLPAKHHLLMTGTPLFNKTADCFAYMSLFASRSELDKYLTFESGDPRVIDKVTSSEELFTKRFVRRKVSLFSTRSGVTNSMEKRNPAISMLAHPIPWKQAPPYG